MPGRRTTSGASARNFTNNAIDCSGASRAAKPRDEIAPSHPSLPKDALG
jgi:hypothetical protein